MRTVLRLILSFSTVIVICSGSALACHCGGEPHQLSKTEINAAIAKQFHDSAMVFSGEVIARDTFEVKFKIMTIWKG
jgi:hypothetical protein